MQYKVLKECVIESIFYQKGQLYRPSKEMSCKFCENSIETNKYYLVVGEYHKLEINYCPNCGDDVRMPI